VKLRATLPFGAWFAVALTAPLAHAETAPSVWDRARDLRAADAFALHVDARRALAIQSSAMEVMLIRPLQLEDVRARLEAALSVAGAPRDRRLRFDLGEVYEALRLHREAVATLTPALRELEQGSRAGRTEDGSEEAWLALAYAHARLDEPKLEFAAYSEYLKRAVDPRARATAELNRAEAAMRSQDLVEAISGYRDAFEHATQTAFVNGETATLAMWGLAVALDRNGDPTGAALATTRALSLDPGMAIIGHGPNVFFVPEYERLWYLGLGATQLARAAQGNERGARYAEALTYWRTYVSLAKADDPWVEGARAHVRALEPLAHAPVSNAKRVPRLPPR
jgi:tetratricopeptide (TPR) repeat protein